MAMRSGTRFLVTLTLAAVATGVYIARFGDRVRRYEVAEASMHPALAPGDYVVAVMAKTINRGDIVVYQEPNNAMRHLIKRVVGLPGETVVIRDGKVAVDGIVIDDPWATGPTMATGSWESPEGSVFTLGDNRAISAGDGRCSGPVPVVGMYRAVWRYWPASSFGGL